MRLRVLGRAGTSRAERTTRRPARSSRPRPSAVPADRGASHAGVHARHRTCVRRQHVSSQTSRSGGRTAMRGAPDNPRAQLCGPAYSSGALRVHWPASYPPLGSIPHRLLDWQRRVGEWDSRPRARLREYLKTRAATCRPSESTRSGSKPSATARSARSARRRRRPAGTRIATRPSFTPGGSSSPWEVSS